ncbi:MAG TPA: YhjD/YihY/BrkB family envelope integrity protein [Polyangiales bacterium]|nr:YhjD/YihY/BrkB family envelope integrity protein [Polyangiales bacterium]
MSGLTTRVRSWVHDKDDFFRHRIWERRLDELPARQARWYRVARIAERTVRSLVLGDTLHVRAAALTYFTVLSLVPLLAFVFAVLKGFGAYDTMIDQTIRPYVIGLLSGNEALRSAFEQVLSFVDRTGVTSLGFIGLLTLFYAATRLLRNVEGALNELWSVATGRGALDQLRDYAAILVVTPLCLMAAAGLTTAGQAIAMLRAAGDTLGISSIVAPLVSLLAPLFILFIGLIVLYKLMPCTKVQLGSAAVGAAIGAVAWYGMLIAHVRFQVGVARFNALYSSFAALPIFLAWLQVSWLMVLIGAQVAAIHQNNRSLAQSARHASREPMYREVAALAASLRIARHFASGEPAPSLDALCDELDMPANLLEPVLQRLMQSGLLSKLADDESPRFAPARPLRTIRVKDVLDALRVPQASTRIAPIRNVDQALELWQELDRAAGEATSNRTLAELVDL